jgi:hypothetical protein
MLLPFRPMIGRAQIRVGIPQEQPFVANRIGLEPANELSITFTKFQGYERIVRASTGWS